MYFPLAFKRLAIAIERCEGQVSFMMRRELRGQRPSPREVRDDDVHEQASRTEHEPARTSENSASMLIVVLPMRFGA